MLIASALCVSVDRAVACISVSPRAHDIAARTAIELLPDPLGSFFKARATRLRHLVADIPERASARATMRGDTHFILLDVAARDGSTAERRRAARAFPRNAGEAAKLCRQRGRPECGRLPWGLIETYAGLVVAFRAGEEGRILADAAAIVHLAADAAMPFNTTTQRAGPAAKRVQHALIDEHRKRLAFEVRVWPERFQRGSDPLAIIFETLLDAHRDVGELTGSDDASGARSDRAALGLANASNDARKKADVNRTLRVVEHHIEAGALLGARLIDAAWVTAGRPGLSRDVGRSGASRSGTSTTDVKSPCGKPFCGSRDSTVYHRATCPHVKRIKPENIGGFSTRDEAQRAGRKACRQCKPDSADRSGS